MTADTSHVDKSQSNRRAVMDTCLKKPPKKFAQRLIEESQACMLCSNLLAKISRAGNRPSPQLPRPARDRHRAQDRTMWHAPPFRCRNRLAHNKQGDHAPSSGSIVSVKLSTSAGSGKIVRMVLGSSSSVRSAIRTEAKGGADEGTPGVRSRITLHPKGPD